MKDLLKEARVAKGLTQAELAKESNVSQTMISAIELGKIKAPALPLMQRIAVALNLPISHFTGSTDLSDVPTCKLCQELENRDGVQKILIHDASSLAVNGDGEKKSTEPINTGPVLVFVVWD